MTTAIYLNAKVALVSGGLSLLSSTLKAVPVTADYQPDFDDDTFLSDVPALTRAALPQLLTGKVLSQTGTAMALQCNPVTFTAVPSGDPIVGLVLFEDVSGIESSSRLVGYFDYFSNMPLTPDGSDVVFTFPPQGVLIFTEGAITGPMPHIFQNMGTDLPVRRRVNILGGILAATDNPGAEATDITIPPAGEGFILKIVGGVVTWSAAGSGSPTGNQDEIQVNDGAGGFLGATNVKAGSGFVSIGASPAAAGLLRFPFATQDILRGKPSAGSEQAILSQSGTTLKLGHNADWSLDVEGATLRLWAGTSGIARHGVGGNAIWGWAAGGLFLGSTNPGYGSGVGVLPIKFADTNPSTNPSGGVVLYADAADSLVKVRKPSGDVDVLYGGVDPTINGFRLSLASDTPVTTSNITGAGTIYFTPYKSNRIALWTGSAWRIMPSSEVTHTLSGLTTNVNYDLFAYINSGAVALERVAWTNATTRATALVRQDGVLVKSGDATRRYVGTFRSTGTTTTEDSEAKRFLWNMDNRVRRSLVRQETSANWTYQSATWRQAGGSSANRVEVVIGDGSELVRLDVHCMARNTTTTSSQIAAIGVGLDVTNANHAQTFASRVPSSALFPLHLLSQYVGHVPIGYHALNWVERTQATDNINFYGTETNLGQSGMVGDTSA